MTDKWFLQDIEHQLKSRNRVVVVDPKNQCGFLILLLDSKGYKVLKTDNQLVEDWQTVKEELLLRYEAETKYKDDPVIFYVTRDQKNLSFLFDYCFTHGCIDLSRPTEWLKKKLFSNTGLQVQMDNPMLLIAAKLGIGKDINWWKKVVQNLEELITIEEELLPFLHQPEEYLSSKDNDIRRLFEEKLFELLGQPYMAKPPKTLANEIVKRIFDGLVYNDIPESLFQLYDRWADSESFRPSLVRYIDGYKLDKEINVWNCNPNHCFIAIDKMALSFLTNNLRDKSLVRDKLSKIKIRVNKNKVKSFVPCWWQDVITLIDFDMTLLNSCNNFNKVVTFYTERFAVLDRAIRNLYITFLQEEKIIRPLQEWYDAFNQALLQHWFSYSQEYKENQQGYLVKLFQNAKPGVAVIVGDGIRFEIADFISSNLVDECKIEKLVMLADMPSETEHNMSALYIGNNEVLALHKERERNLSTLSGKNITYMNLEALHYGVNADFLVLTYKDIDSAGETLQQGAIKLFSEFEQLLKDKISLLLKMGYAEVHLVTDHGFVLTGLLDESDKIDPNALGKKEVHERFIRTVEKQSNSDWVVFDKHYQGFKYVYAAKNSRPFKSKGVYGYSHGGFTPQEIILPNFIFRKQVDTTPGLEVIIVNKSELSEVVGELFSIKIQAASGISNLFSSNRKVQILSYAKGINYNSSSLLNIESGQVQSFEFSFNGNEEVQAALVDALTQEQLDNVLIKKSNVRDLGGLN